MRYAWVLWAALRERLQNCRSLEFVGVGLIGGGRRDVQRQRIVDQDFVVTGISGAADAEDQTEKATVTPGPLAAVRELYGAMLMERGMAREALAAFEGTLAKEPNRLNSLAGAAKAAGQTGDNVKAKVYYDKILAMVGDVDSTRPEIGDARAFLKKF